ncbi:hypothetical protein DXG01_014593 [Tephrocybe rancida]|nr:hypothetical protein DXG01_014593 [Tephrocybe rancida]
MSDEYASSASSEGGYGSSANVWSGRAQRGNTSGTGLYGGGLGAHTGLTDQGKDGEPLRDQFDDYGINGRESGQSNSDAKDRQWNPASGFSQNEDDGEF